MLSTSGGSLVFDTTPGRTWARSRTIFGALPQGRSCLATPDWLGEAEATARDVTAFGVHSFLEGSSRGGHVRWGRWIIDVAVHLISIIWGIFPPENTLTPLNPCDETKTPQKIRELLNDFAIHVSEDALSYRAFFNYIGSVAINSATRPKTESSVYMVNVSCVYRPSRSCCNL